MKVLHLEIADEQDLGVLLPILERLNIRYIIDLPGTNGQADPTIEPEPAAAPASLNKNFDLKKLEYLFDEAHTMNIFADIEDPIEWQRQTRSEWDEESLLRL